MTSLSRRKFFSALASLGATVIAPRVIKIQTASMYGTVDRTALFLAHNSIYGKTMKGRVYYGAGSAAMAILRADFDVYDYRSGYLHDIKSTR